MAQINTETLIEEVRITLDENDHESGYLSESTDNMELNELIYHKLTEAILVVLNAAPLDMLDVKEMPISTLLPDTDGTGTAELPDDFVRLVEFRMLSWKKSVTTAAKEGSPISDMQNCEFTRATPYKPVCVLSHNSIGKKILKYFGVSGSKHEVSKALYVGLPIDNAGTIDIPILLKSNIINYTAGLVEVSRGNQQQAEAFFNLAKL